MDKRRRVSRPKARRSNEIDLSSPPMGQASSSSSSDEALARMLQQQLDREASSSRETESNDEVLARLIRQEEEESHRVAEEDNLRTIEALRNESNRGAMGRVGRAYRLPATRAGGRGHRLLELPDDYEDAEDEFDEDYHPGHPGQRVFDLGDDPATMIGFLMGHADNEGAMQRLIRAGVGRRANAMGIPAGVDPALASLMTRELNENDYEQLLELENSTKKKEGASKAEIQTLPTFKFTKLSSSSSSSSSRFTSSSSSSSSSSKPIDLVSPRLIKGRKNKRKIETIDLDNSQEEDRDISCSSSSSNSNSNSIAGFNQDTKISYCSSSSSSSSSSSAELKEKTKSSSAAAEEEAPECSICMCPFEEGETCLRLPCCHYFHNVCISKWLGTKKACPNCLMTIDGRGFA